MKPEKGQVRGRPIPPQMIRMASMVLKSSAKTWTIAVRQGTSIVETVAGRYYVVAVSV
jgi:hypothetical protein